MLSARSQGSVDFLEVSSRARSSCRRLCSAAFSGAKCWLTAIFAACERQRDAPSPASKVCARSVGSMALPCRLESFREKRFLRYWLRLLIFTGFQWFL